MKLEKLQELLEERKKTYKKIWAKMEQKHKLTAAVLLTVGTLAVIVGVMTICAGLG